jgi:hypothetical protein
MSLEDAIKEIESVRKADDAYEIKRKEKLLFLSLIGSVIVRVQMDISGIALIIVRCQDGTLVTMNGKMIIGV